MLNRDAVKEFIDRWSGRGNEKSDAQSFWLSLLRLLQIDQPESFIKFEVPIDVDGHACFIDGWIPATKVLIEHKSRGIDPDKPAKQSDGMFLTPFEQAKRYADARSYSQRPRWIVICNFVELRVYDMDRYYDQTRRGESYEPNVIELDRLAQEYARLNFLIDPDDENVNPSIKISKRAAELIGAVYRQFGIGNAESGIKGDRHFALSKLCVRLVFCLYAEDSFIFNQNQFTDYLRRADDRQAALIALFNILGQPEDRRDKNIRAELAAFPYVNGDLFADDHSYIPPFNNVISHYLLFDAGDDSQFNWSGISPTIFGALFESTLNPITRRTGGMHYTSIENIHKVIDPLFLEDLYEEFKVVKRRRKNKRAALEDFQTKLASMKFFDPACGSGNFLTETFLSIRRLENEVIRELHALGADCHILVSIENFYGIEVNDFAVAVARTALWIAENQMLQETEMIIHRDINFLPLTSAAHIIEDNALTVDWQADIGAVDYIIGNPPFSGARFMTAENKRNIIDVFDGWKNAGNLDFVSAWFKKAADYMSTFDKPIRAALVATNSINQGEVVSLLWRKLFEKIHIDFAHRTFQWQSESENMAAVHCVIIGFSAAPNVKPKVLIEGKKKTVVSNINAYLLDAPNFFIDSRSTSISPVLPIVFGSMPNDGGNLIIKDDEYDEFIRREPRSKKFIRPFIGGDEFLNGKARWCLWLKDATAEEIDSMPLIAERIEGVRRHRLKSKRSATQKLAATPTLFGEIRQPTTNYIMIPRISSERRKYIPMGFMTPDVIVRDGAQLIPNAGLYEFGVLESSVHMAWVRVVCGRLEMRYNYSATVVYNNFVWATSTSAQRSSIEHSAQAILDARALYPDWTLAALYDPNKMPSELRAAHEANDLLVEELYGFEGMTELEMVTALMGMNRRLTSNIPQHRVPPPIFD